MNEMHIVRHRRVDIALRHACQVPRRLILQGGAGCPRMTNRPDGIRLRGGGLLSPSGPPPASLGGDDRRSAAITLFEDFEQIVTGAGVERLEAEVVENEEIGAAEGFDQARMAPVASGERHVLAEFWPAMIEDGSIVAAGFLTDGASQPALADAGCADQD